MYLQLSGLKVFVGIKQQLRLFTLDYLVLNNNAIITLEKVQLSQKVGKAVL